MSLFDQINADIKAAMLAREKEKLEALRAVKAAFLLAKTEKGGSDELAEETAIQIIKKLVKQRKDSAVTYKENNRPELAEKEDLEAAVIEAYLPAQLSEEEIEVVVREVVAQVGAAGPQDMGKVMGMASKKLAGTADNKIVAAKVKAVLASL